MVDASERIGDAADRARQELQAAGRTAGAIVGVGSLATTILGFVLYPRQLVLDGEIDIAAGESATPAIVQSQLLGVLVMVALVAMASWLLLRGTAVLHPVRVSILGGAIGTVLGYLAMLAAYALMVAFAIPTLLIGSLLVAAGTLAAIVLLMPRLWRALARVGTPG